MKERSAILISVAAPIIVLATVLIVPLIAHRFAMRHARGVVLTHLQTCKPPSEDETRIRTFSMDKAWFGVVRFTDGDWAVVGHYCRHENRWMFDVDVTVTRRANGQMYETPMHYCYRDGFEQDLRYGLRSSSEELIYANWDDFVSRQFPSAAVEIDVTASEQPAP